MRRFSVRKSDLAANGKMIVRQKFDDASIPLNYSSAKMPFIIMIGYVKFQSPENIDFFNFLVKCGWISLSERKQ